MMAMANPNVKLLLKEMSKSRIFGDDEKIKCNLNYASQNLRANLMPKKVVKRKSADKTEEEKADKKQQDRERGFIIQAHAVKVMKSQKTYKYQLLLTDVTRNITMFRAEPQMIKAQIEYLIEGEYMKRDEKNRG